MDRVIDWVVDHLFGAYLIGAAILVVVAVGVLFVANQFLDPTFPTFDVEERVMRDYYCLIGRTEEVVMYLCERTAGQ